MLAWTARERWTLVRLGCLLLGAGVGLGGCGGRTGGRDPIMIAFDADAKVRDRVSAIGSIWEDAEAGELPTELTRERLSDIAWSYGTVEVIRQAAIDALLSDRTPEGEAHARELFLAMLPTEPSMVLADLYVQTLVDRGWEGGRTALVRSLSRGRRGVDLADRAEVDALLALGGGQSLEEIVFGVFVETVAGEGSENVELIARRTREDAWNLVNLISPGSDRLGEMVRSTTGGGAWLVALRRSERDFGIVPMTGLELAWLVRLSSDEHGAWWDGAKVAFDALDEDERGEVALRHLEPLRWASGHRSSWSETSREGLIAMLRERLSGRRFFKRTADQTRRDRGNDERLDDWLERLTRLDLLSILVVDEAIQSSRVREVLFEEARADLKDARSEYGGLVAAHDDGTFFARGYRPRSSERGGNTVYIAPPDLFSDGAASLAMWHLHAKELIGRTYAGPSRPDLMQAAASGRTSLVFTSLGRGRLGVDIYLPTGPAIDLGEIREAGP